MPSLDGEKQYLPTGGHTRTTALLHKRLAQCPFKWPPLLKTGKSPTHQPNCRALTSHVFDARFMHISSSLYSYHIFLYICDFIQFSHEHFVNVQAMSVSYCKLIFLWYCYLPLIMCKPLRTIPVMQDNLPNVTDDHHLCLTCWEPCINGCNMSEDSGLPHTIGTARVQMNISQSPRWQAVSSAKNDVWAIH